MSTHDATSGLPERLRAVEAVLDVVRAWATDRPDLHAVALVGSWARGAASTDADVDLVLLTSTPAAYIDSERWISALGAQRLMCTRTWGRLTERRLELAGGIEIDVGIVSPTWASTDPLDEGTRRVAIEGLVALHDPEGLLKSLRDALSAAHSQAEPPT